jgi:hypothetical protein
LLPEPIDFGLCEQTLIHLTAKDRGLPHSQFITQVCFPFIASRTVSYEFRLT